MHRNAAAAAPHRSRSGFSLIEVLVAVSLFAALSAVVIPTVMGQIRKAEVSTLLADVEGLETAINAFYGDVKRWPLEVDQLVLEPGTGSATNAHFGGGSFPPGLLKKWDGPYLDLGGMPSSGNLATPMDGVVAKEFGELCVNRATYLTVRVAGVTQASAESISSRKDGETDLSGGRVRWVDAPGATPDSLVYLAAVLSPPKC